jgi:hypothetical protein
MIMPETTTHDPAPLFRNADNCAHPEPAYEDSREWSDWDAVHPQCRDIGERVCELTQEGSFCPACTDYARMEFEVGRGDYIATEDCVHAPMLP